MSDRKKRKWGILLGIVVLVLVWLIWSNHRIQVTTYDSSSVRLPQEFDGYTIVQVSDLHNAEFGEKQSRLLEKIESQKPDLIAVTGDLIDSSHTDVEVAMEFIQGAVQIAPVYYVTGNHEVWTKEYFDLKSQMEQAGVTILQDEAVPLNRDGAEIVLIGLGDPVTYEQENPQNGYGGTVLQDKLTELLKEYPKDYSIVLSHRPEFYQNYVSSGANLVLTGHAHGGQVRIPGVGGLVAPGQGFFPEYTDGSQTEKETTMIVSRGLGNSIIPVRINNSPELVVVKLHR